MLEYKPITLEDKAIIDPFLKKNNCSLLNYSFVVEFIYRDLIYFEYALFQDFLLLKVNVNQREKFLYPVGSGDIFDVFNAIKSYSFKRNGNLSLFQFCEPESKFVLEWAKKIESEGYAYEFIPARDEFEYIYLSEDLLNLEGTKLKNKRNHLNTFLKSYSYEVEKITPKNLIEVIEFDEMWNENREISAGSRLIVENHALQEVFTYYDELDVDGIILKVDGDVVGFSIGYPLNDDTYFVLFEKANRAYNGVYAMINREFIKHVAQSYKYINRAEDCGDEGLRKAKLSYAPYRMNEVYYLNVYKENVL